MSRTPAMPSTLFHRIFHCCYYYFCFGYLLLAGALTQDVQLTSVNDNFLSLIAGFTAHLQCSVLKCGRQRETLTTIAWFKDDVLIFNGTDFIASSGFEPSRIVLQRQQSSTPNSKNCVTEEFSLLLKNLTTQDAGEFRCQLLNFSQQLDFHIDVLDSGLKAGFYQNFTYDYVECCIEHGISPLCRAMCKPRDMDLDFFDPTSCKTHDYKNFLRCATDDGRRDYVPCCRQRAVPAFCYDFCSNNFQMLKRSHRLCLYYLPEIFSCFSKQYELYPPSTPTNLRVGAEKLCWKGSPEIVGDRFRTGAINYAIHIRAVPDMSLKGSGSIINNGRALAIKKTNPVNVDTANDRTGRDRREAAILVAHESSVDKSMQFTKVDHKTIEQNDITGDICVPWDNWLKNDGGHYVAYVQASNEYGTSEPSQPLFINTPRDARGHDDDKRRSSENGNSHFHHA